MTASQRKALVAHRKRLRKRGIERLEVRVRREDVELVRDVVDALADPAREKETRALLRATLGRGGSPDLKALLASAPLDGVDLARERDFGRASDP